MRIADVSFSSTSSFFLAFFFISFRPVGSGVSTRPHSVTRLPFFLFSDDGWLGLFSFIYFYDVFAYLAVVFFCDSPPPRFWNVF